MSKGQTQQANEVLDPERQFLFEVNITEEGSWAISLINCHNDGIYQANIQVKSKNNFLPNFKDNIQLNFVKNIDQYVKYNMPLASDAEGDPIEIALRPLDDDTELPPFLFYSNTSRSLQFLPSNRKTQGRAYQFYLALADVSKC